MLEPAGGREGCGGLLWQQHGWVGLARIDVRGVLIVGTLASGAAAVAGRRGM